MARYKVLRKAKYNFNTYLKLSIFLCPDASLYFLQKRRSHPVLPTNCINRKWKKKREWKRTACEEFLLLRVQTWSLHQSELSSIYGLKHRIKIRSGLEPSAPEHGFREEAASCVGLSLLAKVPESMMRLLHLSDPQSDVMLFTASVTLSRMDRIMH